MPSVMQETFQADQKVHAQEDSTRLQQPMDRIQTPPLVPHAMHGLAGDHIVEALVRPYQISNGDLPELDISAT